MRYIRQNHGYSMLLVIFATLLISILGLGLLTINTNSLKTSKNEEVDQAVFYVAEAGINYYIEEINNLVEAAYQEVLTDYNNINNLTLKNNYPFENNFKLKANSKIKNYYLSNQPLKFNNFTSSGGSKYAQVKLSFINDTTVNLISTGFIDSKNRTVSQTLNIRYNEFTKTKKTVTIDSSGLIISNNSPSNNNFLINDPDFPNRTVIYTNKPLGKNNFKNLGVGQISGFNPSKLISLNDFNSKFNIPNDIKRVEAYNNMTIKESMKINNFANALSGSSKIEIDARNNDITIYIDSDFSPKIPFNINGTKNVNIILINGMTLNEGFNLINNDGAEVNMLAKRTANFNTGNGKEVLIQANIIALESTFNLSSNKLKISSNIKYDELVDKLYRL